MTFEMKKLRLTIGAVAIAAVFVASPAFAVIQGDCNNNGETAINELVICSNIYLGTAPLTQCPACDRNGNGLVPIEELVGASNCYLDAQGANCRMSTPGPGSATNTPTAVSTPTPTNSQPLPTSTNTPEPPTATVTATTAPVGPACGNMVVDAGEDCDDGGICTGSTNSGATCNGEDDCPGGGVCVGGDNLEQGCATDGDCPGGECVSCRPFGGDGCAANCTSEVNATFTLQTQGFPAPSAAFLRTEALAGVVLPIAGSLTLTIGEERDGNRPFVIPFNSLLLDRIPVLGSLACACVRGLAAKRCGGLFLEADGTTQSPDCTLTDTCAAMGKLPCSFVNGPGNTAAGVIGCNGLSNINITITQNEGGMTAPPPPTPPIGSGPPILTLSGGQAPPGSVFQLNTLRIGNVLGMCEVAAGMMPDSYGADGQFCTDDDPESSRGNANTLPSSTGTVNVSITNHKNSVTGVIQNLVLAPVTGAPANCADLAMTPPKLTGIKFVGGFTALNQPGLGSLLVTNFFQAQ